MFQLSEFPMGPASLPVNRFVNSRVPLCVFLPQSYRYHMYLQLLTVFNNHPFIYRELVGILCHLNFLEMLSMNYRFCYHGHGCSIYFYARIWGEMGRQWETMWLLSPSSLDLLFHLKPTPNQFLLLQIIKCAFT